MHLFTLCASSDVSTFRMAKRVDVGNGRGKYTEEEENVPPFFRYVLTAIVQPGSVLQIIGNSPRLTENNGTIHVCSDPQSGRVSTTTRMAILHRSITA